MGNCNDSSGATHLEPMVLCGTDPTKPREPRKGPCTPQAGITLVESAKLSWAEIGAVGSGRPLLIPPPILEACHWLRAEKAMSHEGLFRKAGSKKLKNQLFNAFDEDVNCSIDALNRDRKPADQFDIYTVAQVVCTYFWQAKLLRDKQNKELQAHLLEAFNSENFLGTKFMEECTHKILFAAEPNDDPTGWVSSEVVAHIKAAVGKLDDTSHQTLSYVCGLLHECCSDEYTATNRLSAATLAMCVFSTLGYPKAGEVMILKHPDIFEPVHLGSVEEFPAESSGCF